MEMEMNAEMDRDDGSDSDNIKSIAGSSAGTIFCNLERDYAKLLQEMKDNEVLAPYKVEYTRLFETLYNSHQNEEKLLEKFRILQEETVDKTNYIMKLEEKIKYQDDKINKLNQDIIDTSKFADAAHTREQNSQEIIENLRLTIIKLNQEIEQTNRIIRMDDDGSAIKQNESSMKEKEHLINEIETLKQRINSINIYTVELEKNANLHHEEMIKVQEQMDTRINELSKERLIRDKIKKKLGEIENELETKNNELQTINTSMKITLNNTNKLENSVKEEKNTNEKLRKEISRLTIDGMNLQTELNNAEKQINNMNDVISNKNNELKLLTIENKRLRGEIIKCNADNDSTMSKCRKLDDARVRVENNLRHTEHVLKNIETEMGLCQRKLTEEKRISEWAIRDKNKMCKIVDSMKDNIKKSQQLIDLSENTKHKIELELEKVVENNNDINKRLKIIETGRDKSNEQIKNLMQQIEKYTNEIKHKDKEIFNYNKELMSLKSKFQQQLNLTESVKSERNLCIKKFVSAEDEIQDLRDKLKLMNSQIEQIKDDAASKHNTIVKGEFLLKKVEQEKETIKIELDNAQKDVINLRKIIDELKKTEKKLRDDIKMENLDISYLKKEMNNVMSDRDVLGTQLVRRNDELSLQYSKIKILHGTLSRGENEYAQRLEDIRLLKLEVNKLSTEKMLLIKSLNNMSDLRHETYHLNRDLTQERLKVTALEEELQNPINIHRWRKLQGSDPTTDELLKKVQILQKRIIKMNQNLILKSRKVKDTEILYTKLREIIIKQPGPEFISVLTETKKILKERDEMIKCLVAELNMRECQTAENSNALEKINSNLNDIQVKYYALKRKDQKISSQQNTTTSALPTVLSNHKKYCGGGFTMLVAPSRNCYSLESTSK